MADMLVKLYTLPDAAPVLAQLRQAGIVIRRAIAPEKHLVVDWVRREFSLGWASECEVSFSNHPVSTYMALDGNNIAGFACYDATYRNFFGPTGVLPDYRGRGIGKGLLLAALQAMAANGYAYGIIGWVGPVDFYARTVGAVVIPDSTPGIYQGMLRTPRKED
ncbi:MAG: GNAT family N-acetyltransferase [Chloroflexi bacterium]|nr:GNAT family N-acetyltransferase [Chloroflexota bacterium]